MAGTFDFAPNSRVAVEMAPDQPVSTSFRGWEATTKPAVPYRPVYRVTLHGMRWYLNSTGTALDTATNPGLNAGRLRAFWLSNLQWDSFTFVHETLGSMQVRFAEKLDIPAAAPQSGGLIPPFEVSLTPVNPSY